MKENLIVDKSMDFAVRIVNLYKYLMQEKSEYVLSKQLLRSGTSIGANVINPKQILLPKCILRLKNQAKANIGFVF